MVLKGIALDAAVKGLRIISSAGLAAEIEQHVVVSVAGIQKSSDFESGVSVEVLHAGGRKSVHYDAWGKVRKIQIEGIFDEAPFLSGHGVAAGAEQEVAWQATANATTDLSRVNTDIILSRLEEICSFKVSTLCHLDFRGPSSISS